jgi:hypothetical protein
MKRLDVSLLSLLLVLAAIVALGQSSERAPQEVVVVMALSVDTQATPEQIKARARDFTAQLRKQPGALADVILKSTLPGAQPQYLLVMRWRQREDWEAMLAHPDRWSAVEKRAWPFRLEHAAHFTQLE